MAVTDDPIFSNLDGGQAGALYVLAEMALQCSLLKYAACVLYHGPHCTEAHESCIGGGCVWSQNAGWEALKVMGCWPVSANVLQAPEVAPLNPLCLPGPCTLGL